VVPAQFEADVRIGGVGVEGKQRLGHGSLR
jgi:hypothetical protein